MLMELRDKLALLDSFFKPFSRQGALALSSRQIRIYLTLTLVFGAAGYLLKDVSSDTLVEAIRAAARGDSFLQPSIATKVVAEFTRMGEPAKPEAQPLVEPLSDREVEILALVATGASNKEIAAQLFIAEGTVKNHVTHILAKLGARDRTQAALMARELGLV